MNNTTAVNETSPLPKNITSFSVMAWGVAFGTLAVMAIFGNSTVILAFIRNLSLHRRTNFIIVGLATADLLVGLIAVPLYMSMMLLYQRHLHIPMVLSVYLSCSGCIWRFCVYIPSDVNKSGVFLCYRVPSESQKFI